MLGSYQSEAAAVGLLEDLETARVGTLEGTELPAGSLAGKGVLE